MSTSESNPVAQRLQELKLTLDSEIPYNLDKMFPKLTGWGAAGGIKRKVKLVRQIESRLKEMLRPNEQVLFVAKGVQYSLGEQYFMGAWAALINQTVFVLTNVRLLMLRTNTKGRPQHTFWMIYYSQIEKFKANWTGTVVVKLRDRKTLKFTGFPKLDRQQMPRVFEDALEAYRQMGFDPEVSQSQETLCGYCMERVPKAEYTCEHCGAEFWHPKTVALRSLVFPSWGDFIMGHTGIACMELLGYVFMWCMILVIVMGAKGAGDLPSALGISAMMLFFSHVPDACLTYFIAKKGLYPKRKPQVIDQ